MTDRPFQWPQGDRHFPSEWRRYQQAQRLRFIELVQEQINEDEDAPYMPRGINTVIDIGAHAGSWTIPLAEVSRRVIAWEPVHDQTLRANLDTHGITNVLVRTRACSDQTRQDTIWVREDNSGDTGIGLGSELGRQPRSIDVETVDGAWPEIMTELRLRGDLGVVWVDAIKIDVQGHELQVLWGMQELILCHRPTLCVELNGGDPAVEQLLAAWGYELSFRNSKDWIWRQT